jgi:hypothetical protein
MTIKRKKLLQQNAESADPTERRAGCMACAAEGSFCLDLLVTFCGDKK